MDLKSSRLIEESKQKIQSFENAEPDLLGMFVAEMYHSVAVAYVLWNLSYTSLFDNLGPNPGPKEWKDIFSKTSWPGWKPGEALFDNERYEGSVP